MMATKAHLLWSFIRNLGVRLGSVIVFFILARILPPEQLGWFAAALVIVNFAEIFSDAGFSDAIAQRKKLTNELLNTALLINLIVAFTAFLALFIFADFIADVINAPDSAQLLTYISFGLLINAVGYSAQAYYRQRMEFKWLALRSLISMACGALVGISLALTGAGVWSFVAQFIVTSTANTLLIWLKVPWLPKLQFEREDGKALFKFGKNIMLMKILDFTANRSLELFIIAVFGPAVLAVYVMGQKIYSVAMQLLGAVTLDVMLPSFAKHQDDVEVLKNSYIKAFELMLILVSPLFLILGLCSPFIIPLAFGSHGSGAENILCLFGFLGAVQVVSYLNSSALNALGKPHIPMLISVLKAFFTLSIMALFQGGTIIEFVQFYVFFSASTSVVSFIFIARQLNISFTYYLVVFGRFSICIMAMLVAYWFSSQFETISVILNLILIGGCSLISYLICVFALSPRIILQLNKGYNQS